VHLTIKKEGDGENLKGCIRDAVNNEQPLSKVNASLYLATRSNF
jgi:hypothetical protein